MSRFICLFLMVYLFILEGGGVVGEGEKDSLADSPLSTDSQWRAQSQDPEIMT